MPDHPLKSSIVRIRSEDQGIVGCGFLASSRHVLTCAHVIDQAETTTRQVNLDFPFAAANEPLSAWVVYRQPGQRIASYPPADGLDLALLRLQENPPENARPARLVLPGEVWNHKFRAFGFPARRNEGVWVEGILLDTQTTGWAQLNASPESTGYFVAPGFSGTPVWDESLNGVVGMIVAADQQTGIQAAFMIPTLMLLSASADLAAEVGREVLSRNTCVLIKPEVTHAEGREQQREEIEGIILPAIKQAGLQLPDDYPEGVIVNEITTDLIQLVDEAGIVVIDANCYEKSGAFTLSPYLYYFMALAHTKGSSTILVCRSSEHLPPSFQKRPHTLNYSSKVFKFVTEFRNVVQRIQARTDFRPDNPVQEYIANRVLAAELQRARAELAATKKSWNKFRNVELDNPAQKTPEQPKQPTRPPPPLDITFKRVDKKTP
ncbi:MAG TPA: serine protease [Gemmataceae bacterium]|nr:serine protease [Gemmataceae bacterium]